MSSGSWMFTCILLWEMPLICWVSDLPAIPTHCITLECTSRQSIHRMSDRPASFHPDTLPSFHAVMKPICDFLQFTTALVSIFLPWYKRDRGICVVPPLGLTGWDVHVSVDTTVISSTRQDPRVATPGAVVSPRVARATMVKFPRGVVSIACSAEDLLFCFTVLKSVIHHMYPATDFIIRVNISGHV